MQNPLIKFLGEFTKQVLEKQDETIERLDRIKEALEPKKRLVKEKQVFKEGYLDYEEEQDNIAGGN